jgi:hypothetical protein
MPLLVPLLLFAASALWAQTNAVTVSGSFRTRLEAWQWFEASGDSEYAYSGSLLRVAVEQKRATLDWQIEVAAPVLLGLPENAVAAGAQGQLGLGAAYFAANGRSRNAAMPFLKQGFLRFHSRGKAPRHTLRLGRFEFMEGTETTPPNATLAALKRDRIAHRLLGNFGFSHTGRSFDGLEYKWTSKPGSNLTVMGARPTRGVFQVDGWGELDVAVAYGAWTQSMPSKRGAGEWRLFGIYYDDWRDVAKTDNRSLAPRLADRQSIRIGTYGGHYLRVFESGAGTFDALLWGALQTGTWGRLDHRAGSFSVEAGWQPGKAPKWKPWLRGGFQYGSGDSDPSDGNHGTFFQILPTPRWYARFPFYNFMNAQDAFGQLMLKPHPRLSLRSEVHSIRLADRNDLWYQGGGPFQPWTFGFAGRPSSGRGGLATSADASADIQLNKNATLGLYFGNAWGGGVVSAIYPRGDSARLGFVELLYRF